MSKTQDGEIVGRNIAKFRAKTGMTQEEVIARMQLLDCNICRSSYSKIETGKRRLGYYEMRVLSYILNVKPGDFLTGIHLKDPHLIQRNPPGK